MSNDLFNCDDNRNNSNFINIILTIAVFIAAVYGISYFWTNSSSKGKKMIALSVIIALIIGISLTIYLIFE